MKDEYKNMDRIQDKINREIERHPHCKPLLRAFRPVILERNLILQKLQPANIAASDIDVIRFQGGIPIIGQYGLFKENDPWEDIVRAMISAVQEGFPIFAKISVVLQAPFRKERLSFTGFSGRIRTMIKRIFSNPGPKKLRSPHRASLLF